MVRFIKHLLEYLGGERDELPGQTSPPISTPTSTLGGSVLRGLWWGLLLVMILMFCGQSSKFIYIDF